MDSNEYEDYAKQHPEVARRREQIRDELARAIRQLRESVERGEWRPSIEYERKRSFDWSLVDWSHIDIPRLSGMRAFNGAESLRNSCTLGRLPQALAEGFHGRWENLSLSDLQMLHAMGIDTD